MKYFLIALIYFPVWAIFAAVGWPVGGVYAGVVVVVSLVGSAALVDFHRYCFPEV